MVLYNHCTNYIDTVGVKFAYTKKEYTRATTITKYRIDHGAAGCIHGCIAADDSHSELEHWESNQMYYLSKVHKSKFHKKSG
jgi:hypothetical protein